MNEEIMCYDSETGGFSAEYDALCSVTFKVVGKDIIKTTMYFIIYLLNGARDRI